LACEGKLPLYFRQNGTEAYVTEYGLSYSEDEYGAIIEDAQIITRDVLVLTKPYQIPVETIQHYYNDRNTCLYDFINPDWEKCEEIQTHLGKPVPMSKIVKFVSAEDVERLRKSNVAAKITVLTQPHPLINLGKASQDKSIGDVQPSQSEGINGAGSQVKTEPASTKDIQDKTEPKDGEDGQDKRQSQLYIFIWRVHQALSQQKKPTAQNLWREIQNNHAEYDTDAIIEEVDGKQILWCSSYGNEQKLLRTSFDKTLSIIKNNPPI
jgi:hypothetical protein